MVPFQHRSARKENRSATAALMGAAIGEPQREFLTPAGEAFSSKSFCFSSYVPRSFCLSSYVSVTVAPQPWQTNARMARNQRPLPVRVRPHAGHGKLK